MTHISTEVDSYIVEIDDREYTLAPRTIATLDALAEAEEKCKGKPIYRLYMARLKVLLGDDAVRELFTNGSAENVDRLQMIATRVMAVFEATGEAVRMENFEKKLDSVAKVIGPVNEFMTHVRAIQKK